MAGVCSACYAHTCTASCGHSAYSTHALTLARLKILTSGRHLHAQFAWRETLAQRRHTRNGTTTHPKQQLTRGATPCSWPPRVPRPWPGHRSRAAHMCSAPRGKAHRSLGKAKRRMPVRPLSTPSPTCPARDSRPPLCRRGRRSAHRRRHARLWHAAPRRGPAIQRRRTQQRQQCGAHRRRRRGPALTLVDWNHESHNGFDCSRPDSMLCLLGESFFFFSFQKEIFFSFVSGPEFARGESQLDFARAG